MFKLDKEDIKAIARRRVYNSKLIRYLDFAWWGFVVLFLIVVGLQVFGISFSVSDWVLYAILAAMFIIMVIAIFMRRKRYNKIFRNLEKEAGLAK